jgi:hypothetical protein
MTNVKIDDIRVFSTKPKTSQSDPDKHLMEPPRNLRCLLSTMSSETKKTWVQ